MATSSAVENSHVTGTSDGWVWSPRPLVRRLRWAAFWLAILLPLAYVPLLFGGLRAPTETATALTLLSMNVLALYVGRDYQPAGRDG